MNCKWKFFNVSDGQIWSFESHIADLNAGLVDIVGVPFSGSELSLAESSGFIEFWAGMNIISVPPMKGLS